MLCNSVRAGEGCRKGGSDLLMSRKLDEPEWVQVVADVAYALVRAASRLSRNPAPPIHTALGITTWRSVRAPDSHTVSKSRAGVEMSNERSLLGTSLAAETSFQQFFWNQGFKPGFLESLVRHVGDQPGPTCSCSFLID